MFLYNKEKSQKAPEKTRFSLKLARGAFKGVCKVLSLVCLFVSDTFLYFQCFTGTEIPLYCSYFYVFHISILIVLFVNFTGSGIPLHNLKSIKRFP